PADGSGGGPVVVLLLICGPPELGSLRHKAIISQKIVQQCKRINHRKGGKQLLNTSPGLVRTVVRKELMVHGRLVQSKDSTMHRISLEPVSAFLRTRELRCKCKHFPCDCSCRATCRDSDLVPRPE